jgi:stage II sporulation protein AA (anti-sigma F factor antagonist)
MSSELTITDVMSSDKVAAIRIAGRLDARSTQKLIKHCEGLRAKGHSHILVNLSEVSFIASSGIGTLLALTEDLKEIGGSLHLVEPSHAVESVVKLLNLNQFLSIDDSEDEALAAIGA